MKIKALACAAALCASCRERLAFDAASDPAPAGAHVGRARRGRRPKRRARSNALRRPTPKAFTASRGSISCPSASTGADRRRAPPPAASRAEQWRPPWLRTNGSTSSSPRATGCAMPSAGSGRRGSPSATARRRRSTKRPISFSRGFICRSTRSSRSSTPRFCRTSGAGSTALIEARVTTRKPAAYLAQPRLYPGRALLCRRARHRAAQLHRRTPDHGPIEPNSPDRRSRRTSRASSTSARAAGRSPSSPRGVFPNATIDAVDRQRRRARGRAPQRRGSRPRDRIRLLEGDSSRRSRAPLRSDPRPIRPTSTRGGRGLSARIRGRAAAWPMPAARTASTSSGGFWPRRRGA